MKKTLRTIAIVAISAAGFTIGGTMAVAGTDEPLPIEHAVEAEPVEAEPVEAEPVEAEPVETDPELWPAVSTFDEAIAQCDELSIDAQQLSDCTNAAIVSWCEFVPFPADSPHYREDIDGPCLAEEQREEQWAADLAELEAEPAEPEEDEPGFDCRWHGNDVCGVEIMGEPYIIHFIDGQPASVSAGQLSGK